MGGGRCSGLPQKAAARRLPPMVEVGQSTPGFPAPGRQGWGGRAGPPPSPSSLCHTGVQANKCPKGWLDFRGSCYGYFGQQLTWRKAEVGAPQAAGGAQAPHCPGSPQPPLTPPSHAAAGLVQGDPRRLPPRLPAQPRGAHSRRQVRRQVPAQRGGGQCLDRPPLLGEHPGVPGAPTKPALRGCPERVSCPGCRGARPGCPWFAPRLSLSWSRSLALAAPRVPPPCPHRVPSIAAPCPRSPRAARSPAQPRPLTPAFFLPRPRTKRRCG